MSPSVINAPEQIPEFVGAPSEVKSPHPASRHPKVIRPMMIVSVPRSTFWRRTAAGGASVLSSSNNFAAGNGMNGSFAGTVGLHQRAVSRAASLRFWLVNDDLAAFGVKTDVDEDQLFQAIVDLVAFFGIDHQDHEAATAGAEQFAANGAGFARGVVDFVDLRV